MDSRERVSDPQETIRQAMDDALSALWIAAPCRIESFDAATVTVDVTILQMSRVTLAHPSVPRNQATANDWFAWQQPPLVQNCPVVFLSGAGFSVQCPPTPGTDALAIFAHRSIDEWWANGGMQKRSSLRKFSIEDAFVLPGVLSRANVSKWPAVDPHAFVITNADTNLQIRMDANGITLKSPTVQVIGNMQVTGDVVAGNISLQTHRHPGVMGGDAVTQGPIP